MKITITKKTDHKGTIKAIQTKRAVGSLSEDRKQIRKAIDELSINDGIEILLDPELTKYYKTVSGKKSKSHPILEKIRLEIKDYNRINQDSNGFYIVMYSLNDTAHIAKHNYSDIKDYIKASKSGTKRIDFNRYSSFLENI